MRAARAKFTDSGAAVNIHFRHDTPSDVPNRTAYIYFIVLTACGGNDIEDPSTGEPGAAEPPEGSLHYACDNRSKESTCADYGDGTSKSDAARTCEGTLLGTSCPRDRAIATCTVSGHETTLRNTYYAEGPESWTHAGTEATCKKMGGTHEKL